MSRHSQPLNLGRSIFGFQLLDRGPRACSGGAKLIPVGAWCQVFPEDGELTLDVGLLFKQWKGILVAYTELTSVFAYVILNFGLQVRLAG